LSGSHAWDRKSLPAASDPLAPRRIESTASNDVLPIAAQIVAAGQQGSHPTTGDFLAALWPGWALELGFALGQHRRCPPENGIVQLGDAQLGTS